MKNPAKKKICATLMLVSKYIRMYICNSCTDALFNTELRPFDVVALKLQILFYCLLNAGRVRHHVIHKGRRMSGQWLKCFGRLAD